MDDQFMENEMANDISPKTMWPGLDEACKLKGLNYKTACNKTFLQPNNGIPDGRIGGRKKWKRTTVLDWLCKSDNELMGGQG